MYPHPSEERQLMHIRSTGEILVTNDGATILKSIALDNAAAKVLVYLALDIIQKQTY